MTTAGQHYRVVHTELVELAGALSEEEAQKPVPALPGWTIRDTYAHLAGVCYDVVTGAEFDIHDPQWTAGHVAAREGMPLAEICEQWAPDAAQLEELLDKPGMRPAVISVFDVFHHSHDIRGALGRVEARDTPQAAFVAKVMASFKGMEWAHEGRPPIRLTTPSGSRVWGAAADDAEPDVIASLETSDFELARIFIGRRSRAQMLAAGWQGDPEGIVDFLPVFGPPVTDLTE